MSAKLPVTRPVRSDFGPTFANAKPVRRPSNELDASHFNQVADELAQIASCAPKCVIRVDDTGAIVAILGIAEADVAITHSATGVYLFDFAAAGFNPAAATVTINDAATQIAFRAEVTGSSVNVYTQNLSAISTDAGFTLVVY